MNKIKGRVDLSKLKSKHFIRGELGVKCRTRTKFIYTTKGDERIVGITPYKDGVMVATTDNIFSILPKSKKKKK